jgi:plasmid stabilization system protein ParE
MTPVERLPDFVSDYEAQFSWYLRKAGEATALQFEGAVEKTFRRLSQEPSLARVRRFRSPKLSGLRSFNVSKPFDKFLVFYRINENALVMWRLMHGARNLLRRLLEPRA